jgi:hypothetical protein
MQELGMLFVATVFASALFALIASRIAPTDRERDRHLIP